MSSSSDDDDDDDNDDDDDALPEAVTPYGRTTSATHPQCKCIRTLLRNHYLRPELHKLLFNSVRIAVDDTEVLVQLGDKENGTG
jgi:hypothetical protein